MVLQHSSVGNPKIGINLLCYANVGISHRATYFVIPLALATRNLFHNFLSLIDPYFLLKLLIFNIAISLLSLFVIA